MRIEICDELIEDIAEELTISVDRVALILEFILSNECNPLTFLQLIKAVKYADTVIPKNQSRRVEIQRSSILDEWSSNVEEQNPEDVVKNFYKFAEALSELIMSLELNADGIGQKVLIQNTDYFKKTATSYLKYKGLVEEKTFFFSKCIVAKFDIDFILLSISEMEYAQFIKNIDVIKIQCAVNHQEFLL